MTDAILNFITLIIRFIVLIWTICILAKAYGKEDEDNSNDKCNDKDNDL